MPHLTTHVLDAATGTPATGVAVTLLAADGTVVGQATTDDDGRAALGPDRLPEGEHTLRFATGAYFAASGTETFYPTAAVTFTVSGPQHLHVPLLLSPFAYSTYRGS